MTKVTVCFTVSIMGFFFKKLFFNKIKTGFLVIGFLLILVLCFVFPKVYAQYEPCFVDFSKDGSLGIDELIYVLNNWGEVCQPSELDDLFINEEYTKRNINFFDQNNKSVIPDQFIIGETYRVEIQYLIQNIVKYQPSSAENIPINLWINGDKAVSTSLPYGLVSNHRDGGGSKLTATFTAEVGNVLGLVIDEDKIITEQNENNNSLLVYKMVYKSNPVEWQTDFASLKADYLSITVNNQTFYSNNRLQLNSNPGEDYTTLEVIWMENEVQMRMFIYFSKQGDYWTITDVRTYNGQNSNADWLYYPSISGYTSVGQPQSFQVLEAVSSNGIGKIVAKNLEIKAFDRQFPPPNEYGYILDPMLGRPQPIPLSTNPMSGYSIYVILRDAEGNVVEDQRDMQFEWLARDPSLVSINTSSEYCPYGILTPCPEIYGSLSGLNPGETSIDVFVKDGSGNVIAQTEIAVIIYQH